MTTARTSFLIYGATGYTGKLTTKLAKAEGMSPVLAGRDPRKLDALAADYGFTSRAVSLGDGAALRTALADVACVLHMAGPFSATARPMLDACLETGTHYIDITGEIEVFEHCARLDEAAKQRGLMILPGGGFDVVPSDCLAQHVASRLPGAMQLTIAIQGLGNASRGTIKTALESIGLQPCVRRGGRLVRLAQALERDIDYGNGPIRSISVSWGDVSTAYHSTGIPDIDLFFAASKVLDRVYKMGRLQGRFLRSALGQWIVRRGIDKRPAGPSDEERAESKAVIIAEAVDGKRNRAAARLVTPDGYGLTAMTALALVRRVLAGDVKPGFQTPSRAYGADFILQFAGVTRTDLPN